MVLFRDLSIRNKLRIITMVISGMALLLACGILGMFEIYHFRQSLVHELKVVSKIVADRSTASLVFNDPNVARQTLAALSANEAIRFACIYKKDGKIFARFDNGKTSDETPPVINPEITWRFTRHAFLIYTPILLDNERIGTVYIKATLDNMYTMIWRYLSWVALVLFSALLVVFFLLSRLQKHITRPILDLAKTAGLIALDMNFATRVEKHGKDELGVLVDAFNTMLDQIHQRDLELIESKNNAEESAKRARSLAIETNHVNQRLKEEMTKRQRASRAMIESEKKYRSIFENAQEGIYRATSEDRFIDVNPSLARILGYTSHDELMDAITDIRQQLFTDAEERHQFYTTLLSRDVVNNFECKLNRKDQTVIWASIQARVYRDDAKTSRSSKV